MATVKLDDLTALTTPDPSDLLYIVDVSTDTSHCITVGDLMSLVTRIKRDSDRQAITIDVVADATPIDLRNYAGGSVKLSQTHTAVYVYADHSENGDGTYTQALDKFGGALKLAIDTTKPTPLPDEVFNYPWIKLVSTVEDTGAVVFLKG